MLITENYGRGRTAVLATGGTWRWQMSQPLEDQTHEQFWQQLLALAGDGYAGPALSPRFPARCCLTMAACNFPPTCATKIICPLPTPMSKRTSLGREASAAQIEMTPDPNTPGTFHADWTADQPGSYLTEVTATRDNEELGRDVLTFARMDGVAENFHTEQNRDLLEKLSARDGRAILEAAGYFASCPAKFRIPKRASPCATRKSCGTCPPCFVLLPSAEWLLRRKWGVV